MIGPGGRIINLIRETSKVGGKEGEEAVEEGEGEGGVRGSGGGGGDSNPAVDLFNLRKRCSVFPLVSRLECDGPTRQTQPCVFVCFIV